jgi:enoyl-CoA hydratase
MAVSYERREHIAVFWLDDPKRRNALSRAIVTGMRAALQASRDDNARAIVIAARGSMFCAGANIDDLRDGWMDGSEPDSDPVRLFQALTEEPRVVIAAVHGGALGGGFELSLCCDLVVAGPDTYFCLPELGVGVIPNTAAARLQMLVGARRALELILTRRRLTAEEASDMGLVNRRASSSDAVVPEAVALAASIVSHAPPGAIAAAKLAHYQHTRTDWGKVASSLHDVPREEWQEGLDAFTQKRAADFARFWVDKAGAPGVRSNEP